MSGNVVELATAKLFANASLDEPETVAETPLTPENSVSVPTVDTTSDASDNALSNVRTDQNAGLSAVGTMVMAVVVAAAAFGVVWAVPVGDESSDVSGGAVVVLGAVETADLSDADRAFVDGELSDAEVMQMADEIDELNRQRELRQRNANQ